MDYEGTTTMNRDQHYLLCLGLLANIFHKSRDKKEFTDLDVTDKLAIIEAVAGAEALGMPVSRQRLVDGLPIFKSERN